MTTVREAELERALADVGEILADVERLARAWIRNGVKTDRVVGLAAAGRILLDRLGIDAVLGLSTAELDAVLGALENGPTP